MKKLMKWLVVLVLMLSISCAFADNKNSGVYILHIEKPLSEVYDRVYKSLENARFYVVFEPNMGANLTRFSKKWGDDYNQNNLSEIRSMVFCNGWYANKVSNLDPHMLGFCPLHISLIEREGKTTVLFNRPALIAQNSPAKDLLLNIEAEVIAAIESAVQ